MAPFYIHFGKARHEAHQALHLHPAVFRSTLESACDVEAHNIAGGEPGHLGMWVGCGGCAHDAQPSDTQVNEYHANWLLNGVPRPRGGACAELIHLLEPA